LFTHEFQVLADLLLKLEANVGGYDRTLDHVLPSCRWKKRRVLLSYDEKIPDEIKRQKMAHTIEEQSLLQQKRD